MGFRFFLSIVLLSSVIPISGSQQSKVAELLSGYRQRVDQIVAAFPRLTMNQDEKTNLLQELGKAGLERLKKDEASVTVSHRIADLLLDMAYAHLEEINKKMEEIGNEIVSNLKDEGYSDEQIIKGFLLFYAQSSELFNDSIFSGIRNMWKGAVVSVRSNRFLFKLFGNHVFKNSRLA